MRVLGWICSFHTHVRACWVVIMHTHQQHTLAPVLVQIAPLFIRIAPLFISQLHNHNHSIPQFSMAWPTTAKKNPCWLCGLQKCSRFRNTSLACRNRFEVAISGIFVWCGRKWWRIPRRSPNQAQSVVLLGKCWWIYADVDIWDHIRFVVCKRKKEERKKKERKRVRKRRADADYKELKKSSPGWLSETDSAATSNLACGRLGGIWATFLNSGGGRSTSEMDVPNPTAGSKVLELSQKHHTSNRCMFTEFQASTFGRYQ